MNWTVRKGQILLGTGSALIVILIVGGILLALRSDDKPTQVQAPITESTETVDEPEQNDTPEQSNNSEPNYFGKLQPDPIEGNQYRFETPDNVVWYPVADGIPAEFTETRSKGFPRNEEGAALAAWHIFNRASGLYPDSYRETFEHQVAGVGASAMEQFVQTQISTIEDPNTHPLVFAPAGYDVVFFNPLNAEIKIYQIGADEPAETRNENKLAVPIELVWEDEDWKLVAPTEGFGYGTRFTSLDPQFSFGGNWK